LRLSEVYTSVQGEGPNTGTLEQFIRFGGCNMRCPGWPCDTQYAIDPEFRDEWEKVSVTDVLADVQAYPKHVCITGGEPLIQKSDQMEALGYELLQRHYKIDLFTNGSRPMPNWVSSLEATIIMDWKLPGSGEAESFLEQRRLNLFRLGMKDAIKFVVMDEDDFRYAINIWNDIYAQMGQPPFQVYVGKVWDGKLDDQAIIDLLRRTRLPWKVNVQVHKYIWEPTLRGV